MDKINKLINNGILQDQRHNTIADGLKVALAKKYTKQLDKVKAINAEDDDDFI